jgi:hypothetical protein
MPTLAFDMTFQKETKSFLVFERRASDGVMEAILYTPRDAFPGKRPATVHVAIEAE